MIADPLHLITVPLILCLCFLFSVALIYDLAVFRRRRKNRHRAVYRCSTCRHIYEEIHRTPLARCPKCGTSNEPVRQ